MSLPTLFSISSAFALLAPANSSDPTWPISVKVPAFYSWFPWLLIVLGFAFIILGFVVLGSYRHRLSFKAFWACFIAVCLGATGFLSSGMYTYAEVFSPNTLLASSQVQKVMTANSWDASHARGIGCGRSFRVGFLLSGQTVAREGYIGVDCDGFFGERTIFLTPAGDTSPTSTPTPTPTPTPTSSATLGR